MSKNENAKQHYVPACYLANFGIYGNQKQDSKVYFLNVNNNHSGIEKVKNLPKEEYFYSVEDFGEENKNIIEKTFSQIEGDYSSLLKELISLNLDVECRKNKTLLLSSENKKLLAFYFSVQIERTKEFRKIFENVYCNIKTHFPNINIPEYGKKDFKRIHTTAIMNGDISNFYANLFIDRKWIFLINHTDIPFITSDNPCIEIYHVNDIKEPVSPVSDRVTFYIPISPTLAIEIYDKKIKPNDLSYFDFYNKEHIKWYNLNIKSQCTMFLFSNKKISDILMENGL